jgi:hypothetical protein
VEEHGDQNEMEGVTMFNIYYMDLWKYHDKTPTNIQFICTSKIVENILSSIMFSWVRTWSKYFKGAILLMTMLSSVENESKLNKDP